MKSVNREVIAVLVASVALPGGAAFAQQLEEIVVTAQRREQSLQEVPISLETFSGAELRQQGMRDIDDLANFVPTVEINWAMQEQDISIRGYGTTTANLSADQAAPTFVDGVHYSRGSMIRSAFLDLERIEVLRGPQPVYFGQNATVGAFSLTSRKPGPEWEGDLTAEIGNFGRKSLEGGLGGPISDTFGVRVAGKWDQLDGFMTDVVTHDKFPNRRDTAARVTFQWEPTDNFGATFKLGTADTDAGTNGGAVCLTEAPDDFEEGADMALIPGVTDFDNVADVEINSDCFSELGISQGPVFFAPVTGITEDRGGIIDIRQGVRDLRGGEVSYDDARSYDSYLNLNYRMANGIELNSLTGFIDYYRVYDRENGVSPGFMVNERSRSEDLTSWSQEFRVSSPVGGMMEWVAGFYWQKEDLAIISDNPVANLRRARRYNDITHDAETTGVFGAVTMNFLNDKASVDVGGRYSKVNKDAFMQGFGSTWIFDIDPTASTPGGGCVEGVNANLCFEDDADIIDLGNGTWTHAWNVRTIGDAWDGRAAVGMTPLDPSIRDDLRDGGLPHEGSISSGGQFDPQVTLRYRHSDDLSLYGRWAQAFKAGGFETGVSSLVDYDTEFTFLPEYSENWEVGAKGTFLGGRARADVSLFWMEVKDLQIETTVVPAPGETTAPTPTVNAGLQRVRGAEFNLTMAMSDRLTATLSGALMDGEMVEFEGAGCTPSEIRAADSGPCISEAESAEILGLDVGDDDADALFALIDRSGSKAPRTPDWKFLVKADYWMPIQDRYRGTLTSSLSVSDGYIDDVEAFDHIVDWGTHADWNLSLGIGDLDRSWRVSAWVRNLLEARPQYNPEFDVEPVGYVRRVLSLGDFRTYGLQFQYNYN